MIKFNLPNVRTNGLETEPPKDFLISWVKNRIKKNKNVIIVINGPTGSGKSYAAIDLGLKIAQAMGTPFSIDDNMGFKFVDLLKKTMYKQNKEPGTVFLFEEVGSVGSGSASRQWQSKANAFFHSFLQTTRHRRQILIFTCPMFHNLEKGARELCHMQIEMVGIDHNRSISYAKPFALQSSMRTDKTYFKYLRWKDESFGMERKCRQVEFELPPKDILEEYENLKKQFTEELYKSILEIEEEERKVKVSIFKVNKTKIIKLFNKGETCQAVADRFKVNKRTATRWKTTLREEKLLEDACN